MAWKKVTRIVLGQYRAVFLGCCFGDFCFWFWFVFDESYASSWGRKEHCDAADRGKILQAAAYCFGCLWGLHGYANECPKGETSCLFPPSFSATRTAESNAWPTPS